MALTPEDVLKKSFGATQFRRGYDEREVDDFLDEVVSELRDLVAERDDYKRKYEDCARAKGVTPVPSDKGASAKAAADKERAAGDEIASLRRQLLESEERAAQGATNGKGQSEALAKAQAEARTAREELARAQDELARVKAEAGDRSATATSGAPAAAAGAAGAAGLLEMAQRLHDEHIAKGQAEHDRLISEATTQRDELVAEGTSKRAQLLSEAQQRHDQLIAEGQQRHKTLISEATQQHETLLAEANKQRESILANLQAETGSLEKRVASLRGFEERYRHNIAEFIEGQLREVRETPSLAPDEQ